MYCVRIEFDVVRTFGWVTLVHRRWSPDLALPSTQVGVIFVNKCVAPFLKHVLAIRELSEIESPTSEVPE